jgi:hypothetical protein
MIMKRAFLLLSIAVYSNWAAADWHTCAISLTTAYRNFVQKISPGVADPKPELAEQTVPVGPPQPLNLSGLTVERFGYPGAFIIPNEIESELFTPSLNQRGGALISVGTFRVIRSLMAGSFDVGIFFDADTEVGKLNTRQIQDFARSQSWAEFLANMIDRPDLTQTIRQALQGDQDSYSKFLHAIVSKPEDVAPLAYDLDLEHTPNMRPSGSPMRRSFMSEKDDLIGWGPRAGDHIGVRQYYVAYLIRFAHTPVGKTIFEDQAGFDKVHRLAAKGSLYVITGNLAGEKTMQEIGQRLRAAHVEVGCLDPSNAPEAIVIGGGSQQFQSNLRALPFAQDAIVNFTVPRLGFLTKYGAGSNLKTKPGMNSTWLFFSVSVRDYIPALKTFFKVPPPRAPKYESYIDTLIHTPADLNAPIFE